MYKLTAILHVDHRKKDEHLTDATHLQKKLLETLALLVNVLYMYLTTKSIKIE